MNYQEFGFALNIRVAGTSLVISNEELESAANGDSLPVSLQVAQIKGADIVLPVFRYRPPASDKIRSAK